MANNSNKSLTFTFVNKNNVRIKKDGKKFKWGRLISKGLLDEKTLNILKLYLDSNSQQREINVVLKKRQKNENPIEIDLTDSNDNLPINDNDNDNDNDTTIIYDADLCQQLANVDIGEIYIAQYSENWVKAQLLRIELVQNDNDHNYDDNDTAYNNIRYEMLHLRKKCKFHVNQYQLAISKPIDYDPKYGMSVIVGSNKKLKLNTRYSPGVIAETPNEDNHFRYLIFFYNGQYRYTTLDCLRPMLKSYEYPWINFNKNDYLMMRAYFYKNVRTKVDFNKLNQIDIINNNTIYKGLILFRDCALLNVHYYVKNQIINEWIYEGSWRLTINEDLYRCNFV